ncbi:MAG: hypothetical protein EPO02_09495 [Nitrospirae bacterium]|nr:MAG: hypothetical protein EPO02_09495 [Nitrospirota bacterium]
MGKIRPLHIFSGVVGLGLALVGILSFFYGGGHILFWSDARIAALAQEQVTANKVLLLTAALDERLYKKGMLRARASEIKVLVMGSSRVLRIDGGALHADRQSFYNVGLSGATIEDHVIVWEACKELGIMPTVVFWGLDPWIFNENSGGLRWESLDADFRRFKYSYAQAGPSLGYYLTDRSLHHFWLKVTDLLSMPRLVQARDSLRNALAGSQSTVQRNGDVVLIDEVLLPPLATGFRIDGTTVSPSAGLADDSREMGEAKAGKFFMFNEWHKLNGARIGLLEKLLGEMHASGVKVVGFTLPYSPAYFAVLKENERYMRLLKQENAVLRDRFAQYKFEYIDMLDPAIVQLSPEAFSNGTHLTKAGTIKALQYLFEQMSLSEARRVPLAS